MLESVELTRLKINAAPQELIEPVRNLVRTALEKLQTADSINKINRQIVDLIDINSGTIFHIMNLFPQTRTEGKSILFCHCGGLFISIDEVAPDGTTILYETKRIQMPSRPQAVTLENIDILRKLVPKGIVEAEQALRRAVPITIIDGTARDVPSSQSFLCSGL